MLLIDRVGHWLTDSPRALYALAACRIGMGLTVIGLLLSNYGSRSVWVGPGAVWAEPARSATDFPEISILAGVTTDLLTAVYLATVLAAVLFTLGWHTKTANVLTLIGFIAIVGQNPVVGSQGDNVIRLSLLWLLLTQCGQRWSIDERSYVPVGAIPDWLRSGVHHIGLVGLAAQTCLLYLAAGFTKAADEAWQQGNALFYTLQLPASRPFPWLSDVLSVNTVGLAVLTYAVLFVQLFFVPLLLHDVSRRIIVAAAIGVTVFAGLLFGDWWSSLAVVSVTALFVEELTLLRIGDAVADGWDVALRPIDAVRYAVADQSADARLAVAERFDRVRYAIADGFDDFRHIFIYPVVDWIADRLPWRR